MANSADPDQLSQLDLDLHCLQRQGISGLSKTRGIFGDNSGIIFSSSL